MITILHGQDEVASRNYLNNLLEKKADEVMRVDKNDLSAEYLEQIVGGVSLFGETKQVVIENYLKQRPSSRKDKISEILERFGGDVVLWEDGPRSAIVLAAFSGARVMEFKVPSTVFKFLDSLRPGDTVGNLMRFRQALIGGSSEMVFSLLARRFIDLLSPSERAADWQRTRLAAQAKLFSKKELIEGIDELLRIDITQKTSASPLLLEGQMEEFLSRL